MTDVAHCFRREIGATACSFQCADCEGLESHLRLLQVELVMDIASPVMKRIAAMNESACRAADECRDECLYPEEVP